MCLGAVQHLTCAVVLCLLMVAWRVTPGGHLSQICTLLIDNPFLILLLLPHRRWPGVSRPAGARSSTAGGARALSAMCGWWWSIWSWSAASPLVSACGCSNLHAEVKGVGADIAGLTDAYPVASRQEHPKACCGANQTRLCCPCRFSCQMSQGQCGCPQQCPMRAPAVLIPGLFFLACLPCRRPQGHCCHPAALPRNHAVQAHHQRSVGPAGSGAECLPAAQRPLQRARGV